MDINIQEFIQQAGLSEPFYPGKRVVKPCPQPGEYKSHCVVYDWRSSNVIRVEIKAGLSGKDLPTKELVKYPVSFQAATFIEIDVKTGAITTKTASQRTSSEDEDEEEGSGTRGKGSASGGRGVARRSDKEISASSMLSFVAAAEGKVPDLGIITNMVVMGMQIAKEAYGQVLNTFFTQVDHGKVVASDLLSKAGNFITRYTPPPFLKAKGNEDAVYKYDRMKNEAMFTGMIPS